MVTIRYILNVNTFARSLTFFLVVLVCFTAACGPRLIYPNLNWLIPWYLEDYLPMNQTQEDSLQADVEEVLTWHCRSELLRYVDFLQELGQWFKEPEIINVGFIQEKTETMELFFRDLALRIGPDLAKLLRSADNNQIDTLFLNLEKENKELLQKYLDRTEQERNERRQERMKKLLRKWIGDLTTEQIQAVDAWSREFDGSVVAWIDNRRQIQERFRILITKDRLHDDFAKRLTGMLANTEELFTAEYRMISGQRRQSTFLLLATVGSTLSEKQRMRLVENLLDLADDLDRLRCL